MFCQELAAQLARDVKPRLDEAGCKLLAVGIGTDERAREFCKHVGFPATNLYADPENEAYDALLNVDPGNGLEGWRVLARENQPRTVRHSWNMLMSILEPRDLRRSSMHKIGV